MVLMWKKLKTGSSMSGHIEELEYFFQEYKIFLEIEAIVSFVKGRDYDVIKCFYDFFLEISQTPSKQQDVIDVAKSKLEEKFEEYKQENENYKITFTRNHGNAIPISFSLNRNNKISHAFSLLAMAIKQYGEWRNGLNEKAIKEIYIKNLCDKQRYYFGNAPRDLNSHLANVEASTNNKILRQSLIEFHNGISHLNAVYWNTGDNEINTDRAANHFKRGALDSYKAIIKDFCILAGQSPMETIIDNLKILRECEYQTVGDDSQRNKDRLYKKYQDFIANKIMKSFLNSKEHP